MNLTTETLSFSEGSTMPWRLAKSTRAEVDSMVQQTAFWNCSSVAGLFSPSDVSSPSNGVERSTAELEAERPSDADVGGGGDERERTEGVEDEVMSGGDKGVTTGAAEEEEEEEEEEQVESEVEEREE